MDRDNKKIEALIDKLMAADSLEQSSLNFTDNVMAKVEALSHSKVTVYKPLIPKAVWFIIIGSFTTLVAYMYLKAPSANNSWVDKLGLSDVSINPFETINLNFSATLTYAVVLFAIMLSIQIPLLKHYFNKRMAF